MNFVYIDSKYSDEVFTQLALFIDNPNVLNDIYKLRKKWFQLPWIEDYLFEDIDHDNSFFKLFTEDNYRPILETDFALKDLDPRLEHWGNREEFLASIGHHVYVGVDSEAIKYLDRFLFDIESLLYKHKRSSVFRIPLRQAILTNKIFFGSYSKTSAIFIKRNNNLSTFDFGQMAILFTPEAKPEDILAEFKRSREKLLSNYDAVYKQSTYFNSKKNLINIRRDRERYWQHNGKEKLSYEQIAKSEGGDDEGTHKDNVRMSIKRYERNINALNK